MRGIRPINKKSIPLFLAAWIRLFIGSGIEVLNIIRIIKSPKVCVQRLSMSEWVFPISRWIFENGRVYCLVSRRGDSGVSIYELSRSGENEEEL